MSTELSAEPVWVLDCQATGASPQHGHLVELGWSTVSANGAVGADGFEVQQRVLGLPDSAALPWRVAEMTGLRREDLNGASSPETVWSELCASLERAPARAVIHCARYELSFLTPLHQRTHPGMDFPFQAYCTLELARRLVPELPRRGLRALAGYFGHSTEVLRRADGHVRATAFVWHHLVQQLADEGVHDFADLDRFVSTPTAKSRPRRTYPMAKSTRLGLPTTPGVYRLLRSNGDVLYVGKATSLRARVNSHFRKQSDVSERTLECLSQARDIDFTVTATAVEAALLETEEIKRLDPPYNVALTSKDRQPWFATHALDDMAPTPNRRYRIGPLGSHWALQRLWALWRALQTDSAASLQSHLSDALDSSLREAETSVVQAGFDAFRATTPIGAYRVDDILSVSVDAPLARRALNSAADDEFELAPAQAWTPSDVQEGLEDLVYAVGQMLRRAHWLLRLSEASVAWRERDQWRGLIIERGEILDRFDADARRGLPVPAGRRRPLAERRRNFDIATFDRLRVLTTELRRSVHAGGDAQIRLARGTVLQGERLKRVLRVC